MTAKIKLNAASGGGSVSLKAPSTTTSNAAVELQLPVADGSANQFIKTDGSGNLSFAAAGGGKVLQVVSTTKTDTASQNNVGLGDFWNLTSIFKVDITPASASNKILISGHVVFQHDGNEAFYLALYRDNAIYTAANGNVVGSRLGVMSSGFSAHAWDQATCVINFLDTSLGNTNQKSYSVGLASSTASDRTMYLNRTYSDGNNGQTGRFQSTITAMEIEA